MNKFMFALFLGYILTKEQPPGFVVRYVRKHGPVTENENVWMALTILRHSTDFEDRLLIGMVKAALQ